MSTRVRAHYRENRDVLIAALKRNFGEVGVSGEGGGLHLLWHLPPGVPDADVVEASGGEAPHRRLQSRKRRRGVAPPSLLDRRTLAHRFRRAVTPKQIDQGIDRLSEIIDDRSTIPRPTSPSFWSACRGLDLQPTAPRRAPAHLDSRFRRQLALPKRPITPVKLAAHEATERRDPWPGRQHLSLSGQGTERPGPRRRSARAGIAVSRTIAIFALARPSAPIDRIDPKWAKKGLFAMLMLDEGLCAQGDDRRRSRGRCGCTVRRQGPQVAMSGAARKRGGRRAFEAFFWTLLPDFPAPPRARALARRPFHGQARQRDLAHQPRDGAQRSRRMWGPPIDPLRFRANIYVDGAETWEEFDWVGQDIRSAAPTFLVDRTKRALRRDQRQSRDRRGAISIFPARCAPPSATRISASI